jgi:choline dehydrogenase-like flavoprotein
MDQVDILIVGAGASGAAAAWSLAEGGFKVLCLEQGDYMNPAEYPSTRPNWEELKQSIFHPSPNVRNLDADYPINDSESPIAIANFNAVGGSTILFSGHFPRFHPSDFKVKTLDGVADDWPIDYQDLEPFFSLNDSMMGVSGLGGDPAYPPIDNLMPPIPLQGVGELMGKGFNKLGWHWWPSYSAIITRAKNGRAPCINLGPCNTGCVQGAKSSVDVSYWPAAIKKGANLKTRCRVREVCVDASGLASGVIYYDHLGIEHRQNAKIVILACNGVGTPRLLLNSKSPQFPDGIANRSGMVGRNLMLHPLGYVEGQFSSDVPLNIGPQGCSIYSHEFYETDLSRGFVRGYTMQVLRGPGPVETALSGISRRDIPIGRDYHSAFNSKFKNVVGLGVIVEDLPDVNNTITLDEELKDSNGIPAPKITYQLSENSKKMLAHGLQKGREVMAAAGAIKSLAFGPVRNTGWHLMGTAKMGIDSKTSVVNPCGQTHDVKNLYIVDSSIFVTSGGVNPASTLQALALYIANGIKNKTSSA